MTFFPESFLLHTLNAHILNNKASATVEKKYLRDQQVRSLVVRIKTTVSLLRKDYALTVFLVELCVLHVLLLILQDFTNLLPNQGFNIYRICTEKFLSSDFIKSFIVP